MTNDVNFKVSISYGEDIHYSTSNSKTKECFISQGRSGRIILVSNCYLNIDTYDV